MPESTTKKLNDYHVRASVPRYLRYAAVSLLAIIVVVLGVALYRGTGNKDFRMTGFPTALSEDIVATVEDYERRENEGDIQKYLIKADRAVTFSDNHQELDNVFLQVSDQTGAASDEITAEKAVYVPSGDKNFTVYFAGDVNIKTRDDLIVKTDNLTYRRSTETANAEEEVAFERGNVRGSSVGAVVMAAAKRVELLNDVKIETLAGGSIDGQAVRPTAITARYAAYDQANERVELRESVHIRSLDDQTANSAPSFDIRADSANAFLERLEDGRLDLQKFELADNVQIETVREGGGPTRMTSHYAVYFRPADRFELRDSVKIVAVQDNGTTEFRSHEAVYEQTAGNADLNGNVEIIQGNDLITGNAVRAVLYPTRDLRSVAVRGNGYVRQVQDERTFEASGNVLNAAFDTSRQLTASNVEGSAVTTITPLDTAQYSKITLSAPVAVRSRFRSGGNIEGINTEGRTTIVMQAPPNSPDAANRRLIADDVRSTFSSDGRFLQKAEAVGNAELYIDPVSAAPDRFNTALTAPRFDCEFFQTGNNARVCIASKNAKTVRTPTITRPGRGPQTVTAARMRVDFAEATRDVEKMTAIGNAKFVELDRQAAADNFEFTSSDQTVRLRGGEPIAWDSRARAKAREIDWDTRNQLSTLRGNVSTTYYSQAKTGGATPFGSTDKPVYLTSEGAAIDHKAETAVYSGNARAWQDDNFLKASTIQIRQREGRLNAEGNVESMLAEVRTSQGGRAGSQPVYASAGSMEYDRNTRLIVYRTNADIRQGTDRIQGSVAKVYLDERNEIARSEAEGQVLITQPGRRATGTYALYTASNETVVLRGEPARVFDDKNGSSQGSEVTVHLRDNLVVGKGSSAKDPSGRTRSVFKVRND